MNWISIKDKLPKLGQYVLLYANGKVQECLYYMDKGDVNDHTQEYFWSNDFLDFYPLVEEDHRWMPLPEPPND